MGGKLIVLGDTDVHNLLIHLSRDETIAFQDRLGQALHSASSTGGEGKFQPTPGVVNRPNGQKVLFRPFTSPDAVGTKIIVDPAPVQDAEGVARRGPLHGALIVCDETGIPRGLINAEEVTGYRTSLSAMIPFMWRRCVENIVVFGAGKQALWHLRLALVLRGSEVKKITVVNRSEAKARAMLDQVRSENQIYWKSDAEMSTCPDSASGARECVDDALATADAVFCTVPSTSVLFTLDSVLGHGKREREPLISAIGSWQPQMIELDPAILQHAVQTAPDSNRHRGAVVVDDIEEVIHKSGELIQSGLKAEDVIEMGQLLNWLQQRSNKDVYFRPGFEETKLREGFLVYKSVGVGLTDLAAGTKILELAKEKDLGTTVTDF